MTPLKNDIIYSGKQDAYKVIDVWHKSGEISSIDIEDIQTAFKHTISYEVFKDKFRHKK